MLMKKSINVNKMQNGITSNASTVPLNFLCPCDSDIAQNFNGDDQILSTGEKEIVNQ